MDIVDIARLVTEVIYGLGQKPGSFSIFNIGCWLVEFILAPHCCPLSFTGSRERNNFFLLIPRSLLSAFSPRFCGWCRNSNGAAKRESGFGDLINEWRFIVFTRPGRHFTADIKCMAGWGRVYNWLLFYNLQPLLSQDGDNSIYISRLQRSRHK